MNKSEEGAANTILIILVVILAVAVVYFAFIKKPVSVEPFSGNNTQTSIPSVNQTTQSAPITTSPVSTTTPTSDAGMNLKTYINTISGYTIKYPSTFNTDRANAIADDFDGINEAEMFLVNYPTTNFIGTNLGNANIFAGVKNVDENTCYYTIYGNTSSTDGIKYSNEDTVVIKNGIKFHMLAVNGGAQETIYNSWRYSVMHNNLCYQIYLVAESEDAEIDSTHVQYDPQKYLLSPLDQILNTFKFTN